MSSKFDDKPCKAFANGLSGYVHWDKYSVAVSTQDNSTDDKYDDTVKKV